MRARQHLRCAPVARLGVPPLGQAAWVFLYQNRVQPVFDPNQYTFEGRLYARPATWHLAVARDAGAQLQL